MRETAAEGGGPGGRRAAFRSLRIRNFRLFVIGQLISLCGTWMQTVAVGWLVLELSDSSGLAVGLVTALQYVPMLLFGVWGGVIADRFDKRRLLIGAQSFMAVPSVVLALIVGFDVVEVWMVYACVVALGFGNVIDIPARQAFVIEMVGPEDLANAVAINSGQFNAARIVGPGIAGAMLVTVGAAPCFALNAVSFVAVIAALVRMRPEELYTNATVARARGQIRDGLRYAWRTPAVRADLIHMAIIGTLAVNFPVVLPLLAKETFGGEGDTYGVMTVCMGIGAVIGAVFAAARARPTAAVAAAGGLAFGALLTVAAGAPSLAVLYPLLVLMGVANMSLMSTNMAKMQIEAAPDMRGRVMSLRAMTVLGSTPIGGPIVGWVSGEFGARYGLALGGVATVLATLWYAGATTRHGARRPLPAASVAPAGAAARP